MSAARPCLALYTFGIFSRPADDPANDGFRERNDPIFAAVDATPGLIARSGYVTDPGPLSWGEQVHPRFFTDEHGDGWSPATLSLWRDLEAAFAFTYFGRHAEAMARGREWFREPAWPPLVLWWHAEEGYPQWAEGVRRHQLLHDHGPGPDAFTFARAYDPAGARVRIDKTRVRASAPPG
ncbi:DUF3291 domain-containing protein [Rubellimicrobium roseum]|uniref:DUF3291 domain-containing protein n=1 Tax=Rubellimicrobium roseum TaxID=687525 RepID=A0A5C4NMI6_9RHOB|nr:DUF3291 domain-containing protein [Rubellimicrobium roseum]TNC74618.1 DUF3291 domain-containing protein [Rubellimicrobium roseum]